MKFKEFACAAVMEVLYRAVRSLASSDSRIMKEIALLDHGAVYSIAASPSPSSPRLTVRVKDGTIEKAKTDNYDVEIIFKSIPAAFRVFTGQMSVAGAYAAHAFYLYGSINAAMGFVRIVDIAESCLFPRLITRRILTKVYRREEPMLLTYIKLPFYGKKAN
ncbi:MAG: hypothetical protein LUG87_06005 [Oscillospiraceae bacterium]|nr:hypothetical protein [Oscillospiraceae bacterium]